nr:hypothetical protein [Candidatus Sigynarchaeum springense]
MPIVNATITLTNGTLFDDLVDDILGGLNVTLDLDGIPSGSILDGFIDTLALGVEIPGLAPYEAVIVSITLLNSTASSFGARVEVEIFNPTRGPVSITSASFDLEYENQALGNVAFPTLNVDSGRHRYNVTAVLTVSNTTTLSHVLSGWLDGEVIQVEFTGHATSTDVISNIVNAYHENIMLPPCPELGISIGTPRFISSTPTTLVLGVNVTITNPAPMDVMLDDIDLDVSFEGTWVGNVTSVAPVAMVPGMNIVPIQVSLSGAVNKSAVEKILSLHVAKQSVDLSLNGSALVSIDGMASPIPVDISTDESLPGITQDLITAVTVSIITVAYTPAPGMSGQVLVSVRNPFSFGINVTYMKYDVHYDDNDGMYIPIPPTTYPAEMNKFFQTVIDNRSVSPLQLSASSTNVVTTSISSSNLEHCARLFDEYMVDDDLRVHLRNGIFHVTIGAFTAQVSFSQTNIAV